MQSTTVNQFRDKLREHVERVASNHEPLKVTRRNGQDFVVMSLEDWQREQETLYVLQNPSLMSQIAKSMGTHAVATGFRPSPAQLREGQPDDNQPDEIDRF